MALSVLVALMMLAVPLASSSNLFVDGGQTNSNGDAPMLSAAGDTLTINLNIPENSLDSINYDKLNSELNTNHANLDNSNAANDMVYSISKTGIISAVCIDSRADIKIVDVQNAVITALKVDGVATSRIAAYGEPTFSGVSNKDVGIKGQTLTANWKLNSDKYVEVNVNSTGLGDDFVKVKAYAYATATDGKVDKTKMVVDTLPALADIERYVVNVVGAPAKSDVYSYIMTDASGEKIAEGTIPVSDINIKYTFDSLKFGTVTVISPVFDEPITYYVAKTTQIVAGDKSIDVAATTMYYQVFNTLFADGKLLSDSYNGKDKLLSPSSTITIPLSVNEGSIELSSWTNGGENYELKSNSAIAMGSELTLNAEFTTFPIEFMVNGQAQIVEVKYGEFSESSCPFDTTGIVAWMKYTIGSEGKPVYNSFSFDRESKDLQDELIASDDDNLLTLIAVFSDPTETKYVTFDANAGYFDADKKISTIIVPVANGTTADKIPMPANPNKDATADGKQLFAYWKETAGEYDFSNKNSVTKDITLTANYIPYDFTITLYVNNNVHAVLYIDDSFDVESFGTSFNTDVTGVTYNGKTYLSTDDAVNDDLKKEIFQPYSSGYNFTSWNDKDGKELYVFGGSSFTGSSVIKTETSLYAEFDAAEYVIIYSGNTAAATNNMIQVGTVGESLNFFSDSTFSNDGYKLKEWNTRPDGKGTTYALGSAYTLSGADYDKLSKISTVNGNVPEGIDHGFTLYAIWEKTSNGSVTPGDNTDGDNDNSNTDTYLLAGILVVIIILIIVVAVVLRKKN